MKLLPWPSSFLSKSLTYWFHSWNFCNEITGSHYLISAIYCWSTGHQQPPASAFYPWLAFLLLSHVISIAFISSATCALASLPLSLSPPFPLSPLSLGAPPEHLLCCIVGRLSQGVANPSPSSALDLKFSWQLVYLLFPKIYVSIVFGQCIFSIFLKQLFINVSTLLMVFLFNLNFKWCMAVVLCVARPNSCSAAIKTVIDCWPPCFGFSVPLKDFIPIVCVISAPWRIDLSFFVFSDCQQVRVEFL